MSAALAGWVRVGRVVGLFTFRAVHQTGGPRAGIDVIGFTTLIAIEERWGGRRRVDCDIVATKLIGREGIEVGGALGDFPESYVVYVERAGAASAWRGEADAELRDSAGALLKAFDALTDCADVVDSATAALKGSKGLKAPAASAFAETDKTILGAQKTLTSLATSLAAASDTTATLLAKQDALAASYAAAAKVDATATALLKKAQSKGKAQAGALLKGR